MPLLWDDDKIERLKEMVANGDRPRKIGDEFGCSRNAVIGKMGRLGIKSHYGRRDNKRPKPIASPPKTTKSKPKAQFNFLSAAPKALKPTPVFSKPHASDVVMCSVLELTDSKCRWPIGEPGKAGFGFCGTAKSPNSGSPYCATHEKRSHT